MRALMHSCEDACSFWDSCFGACLTRAAPDLWQPKAAWEAFTMLTSIGKGSVRAVTSFIWEGGRRIATNSVSLAIWVHGNVTCIFLSWLIWGFLPRGCTQLVLGYDSLASHLNWSATCFWSRLGCQRVFRILGDQLCDQVDC